MPTNPSNIFENNVNSGCLLYSLISPVASVCIYVIYVRVFGIGWFYCKTKLST